MTVDAVIPRAFDVRASSPAEGGQKLVTHQPHALERGARRQAAPVGPEQDSGHPERLPVRAKLLVAFLGRAQDEAVPDQVLEWTLEAVCRGEGVVRSEEHTSELQSP